MKKTMEKLLIIIIIFSAMSFSIITAIFRRSVDKRNYAMKKNNVFGSA